MPHLFALIAVLTHLWGCDSAPPAATPQAGTQDAQPVPPPGAPPEGGPVLDHGQKNPPLPADNPAWNWSAGGFVSSPQWYGEHDWADVRMRVEGHLSVAWRDRARVLASAQDWTGCAEAYQRLDEALRAQPAAPTGVAAQIGALLQAAAARDARLCAALAQAQPPPVPPSGAVAVLRAQTLALLLDEQPSEHRATAALALQARLLPLREPRSDLDLDAFQDFDSRHLLRVRLFQAQLDALDPIGLSQPWGYWRAAQITRQVDALGLSLRDLGGDPWPVDATIPDDTAPLSRPTAYARALAPAQVDFTVEGLGRLPTGDSLIDVAGEPGPLAIGSLMRLGLDDPSQRAWLATEEAALEQAMAKDPPSVVEITRSAVEKLDAYGHGSRYYNIKQFRNEVVRQLARAHRADLALQIWDDNLPLHNQDWACPNREGILLTVRARLLAEAGHPDQALAVNQQAIDAANSFLSRVTQAERSPGRKPPLKGAPPPPGTPPRGSDEPGPLHHP